MRRQRGRPAGPSPARRAGLTLLAAFGAGFITIFVLGLLLFAAGVDRSFINLAVHVSFYPVAIIGGIVYYRRSL